MFLRAAVKLPRSSRNPSIRVNCWELELDVAAIHSSEFLRIVVVFNTFPIRLIGGIEVEVRTTIAGVSQQMHVLEHRVNSLHIVIRQELATAQRVTPSVRNVGHSEFFQPISEPRDPLVRDHELGSPPPVRPRPTNPGMLRFTGLASPLMSSSLNRRIAPTLASEIITRLASSFLERPRGRALDAVMNTSLAPSYVLRTINGGPSRGPIPGLPRRGSGSPATQARHACSIRSVCARPQQLRFRAVLHPNR